MNTNRTYRAAALLLSLAMILSLAACGTPTSPTDENTPVSTEIENDENVFETDPPLDTEAIGELEKRLDEAEMIDVVNAWVGYSERGVLDTPDSYQTVTIKRKSDLDPYRQYLTELTKEEEDAIFADTKGYCVLVEITSKSDRHYCDVPSVFNNYGTIEIHVSEHEEEDPLAGKQPTYTFFLFHFPAEVYHNEPIKVLFGGL